LFCAARYRSLRPVLDWLVDLLDGSFSSTAQ
jgi:hypothetical protein